MNRHLGSPLCDCKLVPSRDECSWYAGSNPVRQTNPHSNGINPLERHKALAAIRASAYAELFGCQPSAVFPPHVLFAKPDERFLIDIVVYTLETSSGDVDVAVTNGMSDQRLADPGEPHEWERRELIQYFPKCTVDHARRLHDMAWLPLFDEFYLDTHHSIAWEHPAIAGTPWKNAFF